MATKQKITVAKYLEQQIAISGRQQREIAAELGYTNPNIMTMFKNGGTKVPINKVGALAKALNVDAAHLLRLVMSEYSPETWETIETILGRENVLTEQDRAIAKIAAEAAAGIPIDLSAAENRKILTDAVKSIASKSNAKADASVRRQQALPNNMRGRA